MKRIVRDELVELLQMLLIACVETANEAEILSQEDKRAAIEEDLPRFAWLIEELEKEEVEDD